ncbi:MAG: LPS-assembly protein LptD [Treponema sp.]|nr:LPS-assembly protein LptD [Candidatus Treponema equi]
MLVLSGTIAFAADDNTTVITIDGADSSTYKKNEKDGSDEIFLSGDVAISVEKGSTKLSIKADEITYNRTTETLFAKGNIELVQSGTSAGEQTITATSLLVNTSTLEGIFDNGRAIQTQSDALNLPSGSTLIVASRIFGRDSSSTIAFKKAELTFCDDENPHWKIRASRIWLLPGGEFAFFNAVLSIGQVPVLYLPAFYYPKDELIFNPSIGYKERHGYYFQTTTYIMGRKPLEPTDLSSSSGSGSSDDITKGIFNFMKPSVLKEQRREGLILHNLDEDYTGDTSHYLKLIGDYYTNLGFVAGIDGVFSPKNEYISSISASVRLGFTNTVFYSGGAYTPYSSTGDIYKDSANFMGVHTPFRFGANFKADISKPLAFHLSMPIFSDPYFTEDFDSRSESLDWISFFMNNDSKDKTDSEDKSSQTTSFTWNMDTSYKIPLPDFVYPYVSNLSLSSISSSIIFNTKLRSGADWNSKPNDWKNMTPERAFFYPSQVTPIKISGKLDGTLYQYPPAAPKSKSTPSFAVSMNIPPELMTQDEREAWEKKKAEEAAKKAAEKGEEGAVEETTKVEESQETKEEEEEKKYKFTFTELDVKTSGVKNIKDAEYSLTYSVNPQYSSQLNYDSGKLSNPEDFSWSDLYSSYYQIQVPTTLTSNLTLKDNFTSVRNTFQFNPVYQKHPNLDGYATEASKNSVKLTDYKARKMDLTNTNAVSFRPFVFNEYFKETRLEWNTNIKLIKTNFIGDADNPEWEYITADLTDDESVTSHTLSAVFAAKEDDFSQTFTLTSNLPPQKDEYNGTLTFGFPYVTTTASTGIYQKSKDEDEYLWNPFRQSLTVSLFDKTLSLTESYNYDIENGNHDSMKLSASWKNLQVAYTMQYTTVYDFDKNSGWVQKADKEFAPYSFSIAYATQNKTYRYWKRRVTWAPSLSSSIVYDCVRPTNSYFRFVPAVSFKIHEQFELTFSSESQNNVIFRYIQNYVGYEDAVAGETNPLKDLYNSFAFWGNGQFIDPDQENRKSSGFKIKNFKISVKRILHDWSLEGDVTFKPRYVTKSDGRKDFDYHPYITLCVSWHPMPSMKTNLVDDYGTWSLNP